MKKMKITVNEKIYEVIVEVLEDDEQAYPGATILPMQVQRPQGAASQPAAASKPAPAPSAAGSAVLAPIVGTVTKILVKAGQQVNTNQNLIVLDAMKMDTYINAPRDGVIESVDCKVGDAVQVGQRLGTFR